MVYVMYMVMFFGTPPAMQQASQHLTLVGRYPTLAACQEAAREASTAGIIGNAINAQFVCVKGGTQ